MPCELVELLRVWAGIFPVPLTVKPVIPAVAAAVQAKVVPATPDVKVAIVVVVPLQIVCCAGTLTFGTGFTIIPKCTAGPLHPLARGVIT